MKVEIPDDFKVGHKASNSEQSIVEFVPRGESINHWKTLITVSTFYGLGKQSAVAYLHRLKATLEGSCPEAVTGFVDAAEGAGSAITVLFASCPKSSTTGGRETVFMRAVTGRDDLFLVQKAFVDVLPEGVFRQTLDWLSALEICREAAGKMDCRSTR